MSTKLEYLYQLRICEIQDTLERVIELKKQNLSGAELFTFMAAADHRLAEIKMGEIYDKVPEGIWQFVH
ncbi:hemolysin expression modulator Hha [Yersinia ruckeri]|uniref:hemolysin expression modulator Hha n=1 Tax=Yersinia ruckeri TaxID=29486 RepID=UPI0020BF18D1|nr:hemolysin expression modulator Hha [Yersinia ruckeri]HDL6787539.1 hemolysin expression modulator Hha [Yersinia enterocolitica]MCW6560061.1 hemolysin expression modulator Hha [Yersinia ruckeri]MCW6595966.1 hemolysin expression modulator Hha [Yersinia ruckeri]UZY16933.1 hemolysin expression modulator Hha [Yersinia ruckeri]HDL6887618.1 hemolysin expression modulator Hha [Yersinia enterocolitica]